MQSLNKTLVAQKQQIRQGRIPLRLETHSSGYQWLDGKDSAAPPGNTSSAPSDCRYQKAPGYLLQNQVQLLLRRLVFISRLGETVLCWQCWHMPHCHTLGTTLEPFPRALWGWAENIFIAVAAKGIMDGQGTQSCPMESWPLL